MRRIEDDDNVVITIVIVVDHRFRNYRFLDYRFRDYRWLHHSDIIIIDIITWKSNGYQRDGGKYFNAPSSYLDPNLHTAISTHIE